MTPAARALCLARYAWAAPCTAIGLLLSSLAFAAGASARLVDGVLEVGGGKVEAWLAPLPRTLRWRAITLGHVVIGVDHASLARMRAHEQVHVRQYERWGVLFFPLYLASSALQAARGRDAYRDNCFEREAFAACERTVLASGVERAGEPSAC